jgi:hypothetical protein
MECQQCDEGLAPEPTPGWCSATPNDIGVEILDEVADEWLALAAGKKMLEQPERDSRGRDRMARAHGVSNPRPSPRAMRRSTSTDCRTAR